MRILIIAYEFLPSPSPQSLRWIYLSRELAAIGHEIHILAPDLAAKGSEERAGVHIHRTFPGGMRYVQSVLRKLNVHRSTISSSQFSRVYSVQRCKRWLIDCIFRVAGYFYYPDIRGEWKFWASRRLKKLLVEIAPDVVISSHEPAITLELGLIAKRLGFRWVADLGDPVLASYTPAYWEKRAKRLERQVFQQADLITLTSSATAILMEQRHQYHGLMQILPQGFESGLCSTDIEQFFSFDVGRLELLYTGSFYAFRTCYALIEAVQAQSGIRLNIASSRIPGYVLKAAQCRPECIRILGFLSHEVSLLLQRRADILVNIANQNLTQIPGKFNEYLGAERPILHLFFEQEDPLVSDINALRRGWSCENNFEAISQLLARLRNMKSENSLGDDLELGLDSVMERSWNQIAANLSSKLNEICKSDSNVQ